MDFHSDAGGRTRFPGRHPDTCRVETTNWRSRPWPVASADETRRPLSPMAVEALRLLKLPPPATRPVKNHNEAHFIRLGIGRSLYAYRLAYGELPESLDAAVESGIMPASLSQGRERAAPQVLARGRVPGRWRAPCPAAGNTAGKGSIPDAESSEEVATSAGSQGPGERPQGSLAA